jgi:hypothetical protein
VADEILRRTGGRGGTIAWAGFHTYALWHQLDRHRYTVQPFNAPDGNQRLLVYGGGEPVPDVSAFRPIATFPRPRGGQAMTLYERVRG